jgi:radical SAM protein with 4Fe4S-binding SPASM domain
MPKHDQEISMEIIDSIVNDIRGYNINFEIIGGEPLMRSDICEIVKKAKFVGKCPRVSLYTNGTLATPELCDQLKESGLDAALVTLHSHLPEVHDSIAQRDGSWSKAIEGIHAFKTAGIKVYVATVVQRDNVDLIKETCNFVEDTLKVSAIFTKFIPDGPDSEYAITPKKWREVRSWLIHEQKVDHMRDVESFFSLTGSCPSGNYIVAVKADGIVQPCPFATGFTLGKMPEQRLWDIYENRFQLEKFLELKRIPNMCETCVLKHLCGGGCRSASFGVYDGLCGKDPNCGGPFSKYPEEEKLMETLPIHF